MRPDGWYLTDDVDDFSAGAWDFLRSRPDLHTMLLTTVAKWRERGVGEDVLFGRLESADGVRAVFCRRATGRLALTPVPAEVADGLAAHLADLGLTLSGVSAVEGTAVAFAGAWGRRTGAVATPGVRVRLYRLGALTPPEPFPAGRGAAPRDREQVVRWCAGFMEAVGEEPVVDADAWAGTRYADKRYTFWEAPDGTPVSMAGSTAVVGGMVRVDPVYTPARFRGRGYAAAVTVEVSRAALDAGATHVVLFADPANATSNALYQRLGYVPVADVTPYDLATG
ncbi:GNAT family N-acetyltransferase [Saccharothrix sp. Mg75]|uniref:GNAT family N-acetyltransferase n=1 Tax=Saccharothrix sp. Mg75 TaxID=3445357 RepID=UPI003EED0881